MVTVIDLGINTVTTSSADGINSQGQVVGKRDVAAFLWTPNQPNGAVGTFQSLGTLLSPIGESHALGINDAGQVVGTSDALDANGNQVTRAFLWMPAPPNPNGVMQDLGTLNQTNTGLFIGNSEARAINQMGQVVGFAEVSPGVKHAFLWTPSPPNTSSGSMIDLDTLLPAQMQGDSVANDIDDQGGVVGTSDALDANGNRVTRAFLWTPTRPNATKGTMQDLGTLIPNPVTGQFEGESFALGINNQGFVVGGSGGQLGTTFQHPFFGSLPNPVQPLITPVPGALLRAINNVQAGAGMAAVGDGPTGATTPRTGFFYDGSLVVSFSILPLSGWIMEEPTDINDGGQVCGTGGNPGMSLNDRALLINP